MNRLYIYGLVTLIVLSSVGGVVWKWNSMQDQITVLEQDKSTLKQSLKDQKATIAALTADKQAVSKLLEERTKQVKIIDGKNAQLKKQLLESQSQVTRDWMDQKIPSDVKAKIQGVHNENKN